MATRSERVEARVSVEQRARIEQAARFEGQSLSSFIVDAAVVRADHVLAERAVTAVPAEYFDRLVDALDEPDLAPRLTEAAKRSARRQRVS